MRLALLLLLLLPLMMRLLRQADPRRRQTAHPEATGRVEN
jgi:hypothetical protein